MRFIHLNSTHGSVLRAAYTAALNRVFLREEIPHGLNLNEREGDQSSWAFRMDRHGSPSADETRGNPVGRRKTHSN